MTQLLKVILGVAFTTAFLGFATANAASLNTTNYTNAPSTVKILSGKHAGLCPGQLGMANTFTPAEQNGTPGVSNAPWALIAGLCAGSGTTCKAAVYDNETCTGTPVATVELTIAGPNMGDVAATDSSSTVIVTGSKDTMTLKPVSSK